MTHQIALALKTCLIPLGLGHVTVTTTNEQLETVFHMSSAVDSNKKFVSAYETGADSILLYSLSGN
jgi:protein tyrosine phosphatase (PTP) superfamily phosphohydrolase (DUF442 family)